MGHWVEVLLCVTVHRTLPTHSKASIRLLGTNCQVWVGSECTKACSGGFHKLEELYHSHMQTILLSAPGMSPSKASSLPITEELPLAHLPKGHTYFKRDECFPNTSQQSSLMKVG